MSRRERRRRREAQNPGPHPTEPHRDNVPGSIEHASGEVEQFEASLIAQAGGEPLVDAEEPGAEEQVSDAELEAAADRAEDGELATAGRGARRTRAAAPRSAPGAPTQRGMGRLMAFFRASWAELQRVQWPDRRHVGQATAVVLGFVVIAGAYLGLADVAAQHFIDFIL